MTDKLLNELMTEKQQQQAALTEAGEEVAANPSLYPDPDDTPFTKLDALLKEQYGMDGYDILIEEADDPLKESFSAFKDQIDGKIVDVIMQIKTAIKNDQTALQKKLLD